ncbi:hypothetical protein [Miltoncostaea marina]|uniref:hypothetical protein n=1 Tax=Miltoncostaea marina TaxID=2843215 RepID=UPI001C3C657A|nr:hypothetical protein [Miltoncostaea marina]
MPEPQDTQGTTSATCAACGAVAAPAPEAAEPITHCEWCGAEYPVPADAPAGQGDDAG